MRVEELFEGFWRALGEAWVSILHQPSFGMHATKSHGTTLGEWQPASELYGFKGLMV